MKTKAIFLFAAIGASMAFTACSESPEGGRPTVSEISLSRAETQVCEAMTEFGIDMFREIASDKQITGNNPNFVVSPVSMATALSMLANSTEGDVRSQICDALGCDDIQALNQLNRKLMMFLPSPDRNCNIKLENSVWFRPEYTLTQSFKSAMSDYYFAPTEALDFSHPGSEDVINSWAARASHGILDRVVEHSEIAAAEALLANVTYFNGKWLDDYFDANNTKDAVFHGTKSDMTVPMMHGVLETAHVCQTDKWTASKIYYSNDIYIALVRPADGVSLGDISSSFSDDDFKNIIDCATDYKLTIDLPRFKSTADIDFNEILKSMGIDIDVVRPDAMFGASDIEMPVIVTHKARLETNEKGTVAAAYTGGKWDGAMSGKTINLRFDVPFMYFIYDKSAQAILMAGQFTQPE